VTPKTDIIERNPEVLMAADVKFEAWVVINLMTPVLTCFTDAPSFD
jgi:hypothetical protein